MIHLELFRETSTQAVPTATGGSSVTAQAQNATHYKEANIPSNTNRSEVLAKSGTTLSVALNIVKYS